MSRPALAAARGSQILAFLASFPERRFSLTEVAAATEINRASCLAILNELEQRRYLCRHASRKTYWLGPALIATGASALIANPILIHAHTAAERLRGDLGLPVLLSMQVADEIVCVFSLCDDEGRTAGLRAGDRVPLVPPIGASFIAWSSPEQANAWIARRPEAATEQASIRLRRTLAVTRERGFHVSLRRPESDDIGAILARAASSETTDTRRQIAMFVTALDLEANQPDMTEAGAHYDTQLIAAPIFDPEARTSYNLCVGGFTDPLAGPQIAELGHRLTDACVSIMRASQST